MSVRCLKCKEPVTSAAVDWEQGDVNYDSPRPSLFVEPCGHTAGVLFDFVEHNIGDTGVDDDTQR